MHFKQRLAQLHHAQLARKKAKKQKIEQLIPITQLYKKVLCTNIIDLNNLNNSKCAT